MNLNNSASNVGIPIEIFTSAPHMQQRNEAFGCGRLADELVALLQEGIGPQGDGILGN